MPLTSNCDALVRLNESAFNNVIREVMLQRPSLVNFATKELIASDTFCVKIAMNPVLEGMNIPKVTEVDPFPIAGAPSGTPGMNYCMQVRELKIDFTPGNQFSLPPELNSLSSQEIGLKGTVCAGVSCRDVIRVGEIVNTAATVGIANTGAAAAATTRIPDRGLRFRDYFPKNMHCFCLSFFAKVKILQANGFLKMKVTGIEIQDLEPTGLENAIECYIKQVLDYAVLPKMKMAVSDLVFNAKSYFTLGLAPVSTQIPNNPDVSNNELSVFIKLN